jgi:tetratricopeptide (TPR) repeat protein
MVALSRASLSASQETTPPAVARAEVRLRRALTYIPNSRSAWRGLGFALAAQGREDEALNVWRSAGDIDAEFIQRGEQAHRAKRYQEALVWYERAAVLAPDLAAPWHNMGLIYEEMEAWDSALSSFHQAEKRADSREIAGSVHFHLGRLLQEHAEPRDLPAALRSYQAAIDSDHFIQDWERTETHFYRGLALYFEGQMHEAMKEFEWVLNADPEHYWGRVWLGATTWQVDGDLNQAQNHLEQAIALNPEDKWAYQWLGSIYHKAGYLDEAVNMYRRVLAIDPQDEAALDFFSD